MATATIAPAGSRSRTTALLGSKSRWTASATRCPAAVGLAVCVNARERRRNSSASRLCRSAAARAICSRSRSASSSRSVCSRRGVGQKDCQPRRQHRWARYVCSQALDHRYSPPATTTNSTRPPLSADARDAAALSFGKAPSPGMALSFDSASPSRSSGMPSTETSCVRVASTRRRAFVNLELTPTASAADAEALVTVELEAHLVLQLALLDDPADGFLGIGIDAGELEAAQLADQVDERWRADRADLTPDVEGGVAAHHRLHGDLRARPGDC